MIVFHVVVAPRRIIFSTEDLSLAMHRAADCAPCVVVAATLCLGEPESAGDLGRVRVVEILAKEP